MDNLTALFKRIEAPLIFASSDSYCRVSLVKNLGSVITTLLNEIEELVGSNPDQSPNNKKIKNLLSDLRVIFEGYDLLSVGRKKDNLANAISCLASLKRLIFTSKCLEAAASPPIEKGSDSSARDLHTTIRSLRGVGPRIAELLQRKNILTVEDLLYFLPRRYEDRRTISRIADAVPGGPQTFVGTVVEAKPRFYGKKKVFEATVEDDSGSIKAKWFRGREAYLRSAFKPDSRVILTGEVTGFPFEKEIIHPYYEIMNDKEDQLLNFKRIVPVYSETEHLSQKTLRKIIWMAVRDFAHLVESPIPEEICIRRRLIDIRSAVRQVHFPTNDQPIEEYQKMSSDAHRRLIYDEFFFFQVGMALRRKGEILDQGISFITGGKLLEKFYQTLPFTLTNAQKRVISEIEDDMASSRTMNRLIQGDVGSGKTIVSIAAMITACQNGRQSTIMAPTEILANQHYRNLKIWAEKLGLNTALITGNIKGAERKKILERIRNGDIDLLAGTHAMIQEGLLFHDLGLIVIDEQHRFGVVQRATLRKKGQMPDVLVMTATPIPRTLAMTVYGDLDISVIDEMPPGKAPVRTKIFSEAQRLRVYEIIRKEVNRGNQIFIVYPLVEASENLDMKDATRMACHLGEKIFPDIRVGLIHGRLKAFEKEKVMTDFRDGRIPILVSTTVIEVGIDIPEASLMVIEHAERFGLSQLHQLRGRVGRGGAPSCCILLACRHGTDDSRKRLRIMEQTNDGFKIAEEDLAIRGPGEFMGTRQSGLPDFRVASLVRDGIILGEARNDALNLVESDPLLQNPDCIQLRATLLRRWQGRLDLARTG